MTKLLLFSCRDGCETRELVDTEKVPWPPGWTYLPISRTWRCPACIKLLREAEEALQRKWSDNESQNHP